MSADRQVCEDRMLAKMAELKRKPTRDEILQDSRMPKEGDFAFYWSSLDKAIDEIWSKYVIQSNAKPVVRLKTPDEKAQVAAKMREERSRALEKEAESNEAAQAVRPEEVVEKTTGGSDRANEVTEGVNDLSQAEEAIGVVEIPNQAEDEAQKTKLLEDVAEIKARRWGTRYSLEDLKAAIVLIQNYFKITDIPSQIQINQAARELGTPSYGTFLHGLGPKRGWKQILDGEKREGVSLAPIDNTSMTNEPSAPNDELSEEDLSSIVDEIIPDEAELGRLAVELVSKELSDGEDTVTCTIVSFEACLGVVVNGKKMHLNLKFGEK